MPAIKARLKMDRAPHQTQVCDAVQLIPLIMQQIAVAQKSSSAMAAAAHVDETRPP